MNKPRHQSLAEQLKRLAELPDSNIDLSDMPEHLDWSGAKRGNFARQNREKPSGKRR